MPQSMAQQPLAQPAFLPEPELPSRFTWFNEVGATKALDQLGLTDPLDT